MLDALLMALAIAAFVFCFVLVRAAARGHSVPAPEAVVLGGVTNFFDTLGIGSFAPTMAWFKFRRLVEDRLIPQTMLVGHTTPTIVQAVIFLILLGVFVDPVLLVGCVAAVWLGALLGAQMVARTRVRIIQLIVGIALAVAALFYSLSNLNLMPVGGRATGLPIGLMGIAIAANFVFGVLINFGVGNYAPTLAMLSLMGMNPRLCFPIMAGGAALAATSASIRHVAIGEIDLRIATGMAIGGVPAVLAAAFLVKSLPIEWLRWLVTLVVLYAAGVMLRSAFVTRRSDERSGPT